MRCKPFTVVLREVVVLVYIKSIISLYSCNYADMCVLQEECVERFKELCTIVKNRKDAQSEQ